MQENKRWRVSVTMLLALCALMLPARAFGQASIVGAATDASGAVLPGVTVEASSPALIERVRTAVTDGTGQYRIVDLRPGTYTVTFTLPGFNTVKREGVELTGTFTATVDAELRVGALEETITVTGETPIVDVQSATRQRVMEKELVDSLPTARTPFALGYLVPGVTMSGAVHEVGGSVAPVAPALMIHGSRSGDFRTLFNGVDVGSFVGDAFGSSTAPNPSALQEVVIDTSSVSAELPMGGVRINYIPRDGGNVFSGSLFAAGAHRSMQGDNLSDDLRERGLLTATSIDKNYDVNGGFGGPIRQDQLWFFVGARYNGMDTYPGGIFYNKNENNPNVWTYEPDTSRAGKNEAYWATGTLRLTWQASQKHKIGIFWNKQDQCQCPATVAATLAPEAARKWYFPNSYEYLTDWTSPLTNRVLLEATAVYRHERYIMGVPDSLNRLMISVTEQSNGLLYRARDVYANNLSDGIRYRAAASHITGAHAFKVGFNNAHGYQTSHFFNSNPDFPVAYRFNNGVPNQLTQYAWPYDIRNDVKQDLGLYAQDKWTIRRLTVSAGIRFDYFKSGNPVSHLGPAVLTPTRDLDIPAMISATYKDLSPKFQSVYDLFGTGKTALKVSLNRYVRAHATGDLASARNPINTLVLSTSRAWTDANGNFVPDCNLSGPDANGECGAMANRFFGQSRQTVTYDPDVLEGWGNRNHNWEFSGAVQQEILPRVSVDVGYFRRVFHNIPVTDNRAVAPSDYAAFGLPAPNDSRLPAAGSVISGVHDLNPAVVGLVDNFVTLAERHGKYVHVWKGFDLTLSARPRNGLMVQGGLSTGGTTINVCDVATKVPEMLFGFNTLGAWTPLAYCDQDAKKWNPNVKLLSAYTVPRIDVLISGTFQSLPGPEVLAIYNAPNAVVIPVLGRPLSASAANISVQVQPPGQMYGERLNQLDLRFGKILRFGRLRSTVNLDLYNALNGNAVLSQNNNFAVWQRPTSILMARFAKISLQMDF